MDLVSSQHICLCIICSKAPHEPASVFSVIDLRIHLLIFISDLLDGCFFISNQIVEELNCFLVFLFGPVKIIAAEHVYKLCKLVKCISFLPGTAVAESSVLGNSLHILHEILFCINGFDSDLIHDLLIYPECKISCIAWNTDNVSVLICDHILYISLGKLISDIICHYCIIQSFQPSGIFKCRTHLIVDLNDIHGSISCGKHCGDLLLTGICICRCRNYINVQARGIFHICKPVLKIRVCGVDAV